MATAVWSMRMKTTEAATGTSRTKTISPLLFTTTSSNDERDLAIKYMAQRLVALTTSTYVSTDRITTVNVDSVEVTTVG